MVRCRPAAVPALLSVLAGTGACTDDQEAPPPPSQKLDVIVNVFPLQWLAGRIAAI